MNIFRYLYVRFMAWKLNVCWKHKRIRQVVQYNGVYQFGKVCPDCDFPKQIANISKQSKTLQSRHDFLKSINAR